MMSEDEKRCWVSLEKDVIGIASGGRIVGLIGIASGGRIVGPPLIIIENAECC